MDLEKIFSSNGNEYHYNTSEKKLGVIELEKIRMPFYGITNILHRGVHPATLVNKIRIRIRAVVLKLFWIVYRFKI